VFKAGNQGAIFFCIHGAGESALSFALLAKEISHFGTLISYDLKGHGYSKRGGNLDDMSIDTLVNEAADVLKELLTRYPDPNFIMVGHSLGGSICCRLTELAGNEAWGKRVQGMIIIDIAEGTALEALPFMMNILDNRPKIFKSQDAAIQWRYSWFNAACNRII
jgi:protein phosphatase methylesterase 1